MESPITLDLTLKQFSNRWNCIGITPRNRTIGEKLLFLITLFLSVLFAVSSSLNIIFTRNISMALVIENVLAVISFSQAIVELVVCYLKPDVIDDMLNMILHNFWTTDSVDPVVAKNILKIYKMSRLATNVFRYSLISCSMYILVPIISGNFAWDIWVPFDKESLKTFPYYEIVVIIQIIAGSFALYFAIGPFDMFFLINMGLVCGQFRLLKEEFKNIGKTTEYDVVIKCVKHHNLILLFLEKLKTLYTIPILIIFGIELIIITLSLYVILTDNMESGSYRFIFIIAASTLQILVYCFCGQVIKDESFSVSLAVYNSDWENCDRATILSILNIMCRAQREVVITMGGFQALSLEGFVNIARAIFSYLTVMRETVKYD